MPVDERCIEERVLLPIAIKYKAQLMTDPEAWVDYEIKQIIAECGTNWSAMPIENVRRQCCNLRKRGLLPKSKEDQNFGPTKHKDVPPGYETYLQTTWWKQFRLKVLEWWGYCCCWCNSNEMIEVHHRTYERLGHEQLQDCIALCKNCHLMADRARKREKKRAKILSLYGG